MSELQKGLVQRSMTELPGDLDEEILCRVPATSLKRLRTTCKRWNRLFNDKNFARKHSDKAAKQFQVLMVTNKYRVCPVSVNLHGLVPSVEVKSELSLVDPKNPDFQFDIAAVFHCEGLLLCTYESRIAVWNLLTGQRRWIEPGDRDKEDPTFVLGYNQDKKSCSKNYKILAFDTFRSSKASEIYDFSSDSWRTLDYPIPPGWSLPFFEHCVSLKGNAYMFAEDGTKTHMCISLLKFDFSKEKTEPLPRPCQWHDYETISLSAVKEEKLSVLLRKKYDWKAEVWVTNKIDETKVVSWSKVLVLELSPHLLSTYVSFLLDEEKKVLMACTRWVDEEDEAKSKDMIYTVGEDNKITQVEFAVDTRIDICWPIIHNYVPSLVQIELAGGKRKRSD